MLIPQENQGFPQPTVPIVNSQVTPSVSVTWSKFIPRVNWFFLILSAIFVFGIDLIILIESSDWAWFLIWFWVEMLFVFGIFILFLFIENFKFRKIFSSTKSRLDLFIGALVVVRNIVIFLNFIPGIQLLGAVIGIYAGVPFLLIYYLVIWQRYKRS